MVTGEGHHQRLWLSSHAFPWLLFRLAGLQSWNHGKRGFDARRNANKSIFLTNRDASEGDHGMRVSGSLLQLLLEISRNTKIVAILWRELLWAMMYPRLYKVTTSGCWLVTGYCLTMGVVSQLRIVHHAMNGRGEGAGNGCMGAATGEYSSLFSLEEAKKWQSMT